MDHPASRSPVSSTWVSSYLVSSRRTSWEWEKSPAPSRWSPRIGWESGFGGTHYYPFLPTAACDLWTTTGSLVGGHRSLTSGLHHRRLAIFFFVVSVGAHWSCVRHGRMAFAMTWYSMFTCHICKNPLILDRLHLSKHRTDGMCLCRRWRMTDQGLTLPIERNICRRQGPQPQPSHPYIGLCVHLPPNRRLVLRLHHDDPGRDTKGHLMAAKTGGQR